MIWDLAQYAAAVLMLLGALFSVAAALGVLRFPDLYTRLHAASKAGLVGAGLIFCAVAIVAGDGATAMRAVLGILFLTLTTPVSAHLLARAAYRSGERPASATAVDDWE